MVRVGAPEAERPTSRLVLPRAKAADAALRRVARRVRRPARTLSGVPGAPATRAAVQKRAAGRSISRATPRQTSRVSGTQLSKLRLAAAWPSPTSRTEAPTPARSPRAFARTSNAAPSSAARPAVAKERVVRTPADHTGQGLQGTGSRACRAGQRSARKATARLVASSGVVTTGAEIRT